MASHTSITIKDFTSLNMIIFSTKVGGIHDLDADDTALSCLVAIGRPQPSYQETIDDCLDRGQERDHGVEFSSRHAADGKFSFVDPRVTLILGYLGQELLGSSLYEYIHYDDIPTLSQYHRKVLKTKEEVTTPCYRWRTKEGRFVTVESRLKQFMNPWTKELEYIVCKHSLVISDQKYEECSEPNNENSDNDHLQNQQQLEYKGT